MPQAPTTEVSIDPKGLRFRYLRPGSPTVPESFYQIRWDEVAAVVVRRRIFGDVVVRYIEFYLDDGWHVINDQPWVAGWDRVLADLPAYLPLRQADWRERFAALRPEDKSLLIFQRGPELPAFLQEECEQCGSTWEFQE